MTFRLKIFRLMVALSVEISRENKLCKSHTPEDGILHSQRRDHLYLTTT